MRNLQAWRKTTAQLREAADLFRRAADNGVMDASYQLGRLYQQGLGIPVDPVAAFENFLVAAEGRVVHPTAGQRDENESKIFLRYRPGLLLGSYSTVGELVGLRSLLLLWILCVVARFSVTIRFITGRWGLPGEGSRFQRYWRCYLNKPITEERGDDPIYRLT